MARGVLTPFRVTATENVFGLNTIIFNGVALTEMASMVSFDLSKNRIYAVGTANRLTFIEFWQGAKGAGVAATIQDAGNTITKTTHGLVADDRIMLSALATSTGIDLNTAYYVYNVVGDTFQLSLTASTNSPAAVAIGTGDGTCTYHKITSPTIFAEGYVSRTSTSPDTTIIPMLASRIPIANVVWARAKSLGGANTVDYFIGVHYYQG
jgi:hypothetical protein